MSVCALKTVSTFSGEDQFPERGGGGAMEFAERLKGFEECYDIIFLERLDVGEKIFIGTRQSRKCRFCGKDESQTSFKTIAHAIPEAIGNKRVILLEECDECNKYFSEEIENSFDKYSKVFRILGGVKGKKRPPGYKTRDKESKLKVDKENRTLKIDGDVNKILVPKENTQDSHLMTIEREPYIPLAVYKTLVKMALSIVPIELLPNFSQHIDWLMNRETGTIFTSPLFLVERVLLGPSFGVGSSAMLFVRKESSSLDNPYAMLFISFGCAVFQIAIPEGPERITRIPLFPIPSEDQNDQYGCTQMAIDLSGKDWVKGDDITINISQQLT